MSACVEKKAASQKARGAVAPRTHAPKKATRRSRSESHEPSGLREGYATAAHAAGTRRSASARPTASVSPLNGTNPSRD